MTFEPNVTKSKPMYDLDTKLTTWEETRHETGYELTRTVTATEWVETNRTDCYCCSCPEEGGADAYCRNHGFAGERPCETHNLPGYIDEHFTPGLTKMHDSVQEVWRRYNGS